MTISAPDQRTRRLQELFDFGQGRGLEVGPLAHPVARKGEVDVEYVDVFDREALMKHYAGRAFDVEDIPEMDYTLWDGERVRTLGEAVADGAPFDWVFASHVLEHVPDAVGWLRDIASVTAPGGALVLAVPDQRFTFDYHRPPTSVGQLLQAFESQDVVPSVRAVYDHFSSVVSVKPAELWSGVVPGREARIHKTLGPAQANAERAAKGEYVDCHVWLFTPQTFRDQLAELAELGLVDWYVEELVETPRNQIEFHVLLRRGPRPADVPAHESEAPAWTLREREHQEALRQVAELDGRLAGQPRAEQLQRRVQRQRKRIERLERELATLKSSKRWQLAESLAKPVDRLRGLLRR